MTKIKHIINIYLALENYIEKLKKNQNEELAEDIQDTINYIIEKNVTEVIPLTKIWKMQSRR